MTFEQYHVLEGLQLYDLSNDNEHSYITYHNLKMYILIDLSNYMLRKTMRELRALGYADYTYFGSEDNYLVCGSGHSITAKGLKALNEFKISRPSVTNSSSNKIRFISLR